MESGAGEELGAGLAGDYAGLRSRSAEAGVNWSVDYTGEVLGNVMGGLERGAVYTGLLALASELDLGRTVGWERAVLSGSAVFPHGESLTEGYTGDLFVASNLDARQEFRLFELWVEDLFWEERLSLRVGQLAADSEFAGTERGSLFVNATLGWPAILGVNVPAPAYPVGALGGLKLGGWYHTGLFEHQRMDSAGRSLADPAGSGEPRLVRGNGGFYATLEQELTRESVLEGGDRQGLGMFGRVGWASGDRNPVQVYIDGRVTYQGLIPVRNADLCGVAVAYGGMSRDLRRLGADAAALGEGGVRPDYEVVVEGAYQFEVRSGWVVQYMVHPGGTAELDDALALGVRTTLTL